MMPGSLSNTGEQRALTAAVGSAYLGLVTTTPSETSPGTEVTGGNYARQFVELTAAEGDPTTFTNTAAVEFPPATADWGTVEWGVLMTDVSAGEYRAYVQFTDPNDPGTPLPQTINSGNIVRIPANALRITLE